MFRAKRIDNGEIYQVLDTWFDEYFHKTYFLIWDNGDWRWRPAKNFIPPGVEVKDEQ